MKPGYDNIPVVVTPLDNHMGVDIARSLGRRGVPVYGIDPDPSTSGRFSRYVKLVESPDWRTSRENFIEFMIGFGHGLGCKPVLFALSDDDVRFISENRAVLSVYYEFVMPSHETVLELITKSGLSKLAENLQIPAPKTLWLGSATDLQVAVEKFNFPVILKPVESLYWRKKEIADLLRENLVSGYAKVVLCNNKNELFENYRRIAVFDNRMVVQEVIPGDDDRLVYFASYTNRQAETIASFAGRKIRVIPSGFGSASYVKTISDPELSSIALKLLAEVKYQGPCGIEFKKDLRDNRYKLIEVNARFGMWDGLSTKVGVDLPYVAYCDAIGRQVAPRHVYPVGVIWIDYFRDFRAFLIYYRLGKLSFWRWLRSLLGNKMIAMFAWDDPLPFLFTGLKLLGKLI